MRKPNPYKEELTLARSQRRRLQTIVSNLSEMSAEWGDLHGGLECDFNLLADVVQPQLEVLDKQIEDWSNGRGDRDES